MELFFDTETSGLPGKNPSDPNYPWIVQLAYILSDEDRIYTQVSTIIADPTEGRVPITKGAEDVHGISLDVTNSGISEYYAMQFFLQTASQAHILVCHNFDFDIKLVHAMLHRWKVEDRFKELDMQMAYCTMKGSTDFCKLPSKRGGYKWPKLEELHYILFGGKLEETHDALVDVRATRKCYYELRRRGELR